MRPPIDRAGMTLIEVTLALAIVSVVLTGGYVLYGTAQTVSMKVDGSLTLLAAESSQRSAIESWLRYPVVRTGAGFHGFDQAWRGVDDDRLQLVVRSPRPGARGLWRLELLIDRDEVTPEEGLVAILTSAVDGRATRLEVVPAVGRLDVTFLGTNGFWLSSWGSQSVAPRAVRIDMGPRPGAELPPLLSQPWVVAIGEHR